MRALLRIFTLYSPFHRPGYLCQSEPGDVHMPFEHCLPIHGFWSAGTDIWRTSRCCYGLL